MSASEGIRRLAPGDQAALDAFLARHPDSSMFLRSNVRAAGLVYRGRHYQATYVAAMDGERVGAVAAHCWNGIVVVQAPRRLEEVVREVLAASARPVGGLSGPADQVAAARRILRLEGAATTTAAAAGLFAVPLAELAVPPTLAAGTVRCRQPHRHELDLLVEWRMAFAVEALGFAEGATLEHEARADVERLQDEGSHWILLEGAQPVAYSAFNARLPEAVQIGGVWTPPEWRGRGYARAVVAGSLLAARDAGVARAVLFAHDPAAIRSYETLGFRRAGEYGLVLFREPVAVR